jgi:hypothetical protein
MSLNQNHLQPNVLSKTLGILIANEVAYRITKLLNNKMLNYKDNPRIRIKEEAINCLVYRGKF